MSLCAKHRKKVSPPFRHSVSAQTAAHPRTPLHMRHSIELGWLVSQDAFLLAGNRSRPYSFRLTLFHSAGTARFDLLETIREKAPDSSLHEHPPLSLAKAINSNSHPWLLLHGRLGLKIPGTTRNPGRSPPLPDHLARIRSTRRGSGTTRRCAPGSQ